MPEVVLHPVTASQLASFTSGDNHAVLLVGPAGSGKATAARQIGQDVLKTEVLETHPYVRILTSEDGKAIGIETVREVEQFFRLKVPGLQGSINRLVIIEDAHLLTAEAQNALLKTLEEPPEGSLLILTASHEQSLLPTIRSRAQSITIKRPPTAEVNDFFKAQSFTDKDIDHAYRVSGGLPGLMSALLSDNEHPLLPAIEMARQLLQKTSFERLAMVDELVKQRTLTVGTLFVLQQMAHVSLQTANAATSKRWQNVLKASYEATEALNNSGQPKLVLTDFMLRF